MKNSTGAYVQGPTTPRPSSTTPTRSSPPPTSPPAPRTRRPTPRCSTNAPPTPASTPPRPSSTPATAATPTSTPQPGAMLSTAPKRSSPPAGWATTSRSHPHPAAGSPGHRRTQSPARPSPARTQAPYCCEDKTPPAASGDFWPPATTYSKSSATSERPNLPPPDLPIAQFGEQATRQQQIDHHPGGQTAQRRGSRFLRLSWSDIPLYRGPAALVSRRAWHQPPNLNYPVCYR